MEQIFCTLFDSNYLDKGLVLYKSMEEHMNNDFKLYVFAFDEKTEEILKAEKFNNMIVISLSEFESEELLKVKTQRTRAEYCWTCTPWTIKYVLEKYNESVCTYIDADMMFFGAPQMVFDEMRDKGCSIAIVPHRFKTEKEQKKARETRGEYCVQFNTFFNDKNGLKALNWWAERCLEWCFYAKPGTTEWYGDQKYLNVFEEKFEGVLICKHFGIGLAPWNVDQVNLVTTNNNGITIQVEKTGEVFPVIIYHFESVNYLTTSLINTPSRRISKKLYDAIYIPYCQKIVRERQILKEKYNHIFSYKRRIVTNNPFMKFYQKYLLPIRHMRGLTSIYRIEEN